MKKQAERSLYLVTNSAELSLEDFLQIVRLSIEGGVTMVQLREKEMSSKEMCRIGRKLLSYLKPQGIPLIINDRLEVAHDIQADGVHLGQSDLEVSEARAILGQNAIIGLSVENMDHVQKAESQMVDYLAASPLFHTKTKSNCSPPWGLDNLTRLCSISRHPVIAIGGINEANLESVLACGVSGIAVVSAIFNAPCPKKSAETLIKKMKTYGK